MSFIIIKFVTRGEMKKDEEDDEDEEDDDDEEKKGDGEKYP